MDGDPAPDEAARQRHDIMFLAGHFSANSALAADFQTSVLTTELAASTVDLQNAIVFSAGCHSGYNLVDGEAVPGSALPLDWAQAFAQKRATLIAGTGYQYGDTDFLEYSERLYRDFASELRAGDGRRLDRRGAGAGEADLPRDDAGHPWHPREGDPRDDVVRPADARREHAGRPRRQPGTGAADRADRGRRRSKRTPIGLATHDLHSRPDSLTPNTLSLKNPPTTRSPAPSRPRRG